MMLGSGQFVVQVPPLDDLDVKVEDSEISHYIEVLCCV